MVEYSTKNNFSQVVNYVHFVFTESTVFRGLKGPIFCRFARPIKPATALIAGGPGYPNI